MKNKKLLTSILVIPVITMGFITLADTDCSSLDRETMMEIMEKKRNGETLTDEEETLFESAESCRPEGGRGGEGMEEWMRGQGGNVSDEQKAEMESILEKVENGETLTDEEQEKYDIFLEKSENRDNQGTEKKRRNVGKISENIQAKITAIIEKISNNYTDLSDEEKIEKYTALSEKLESSLEKILDNEDYSDEKKELFTSIINELLNQIDEEIELID